MLAGTSATGLAAKNPEKNRASMIVCVSLAVADAMMKISKPNIPTSNGMRRPTSSDIGAQTVGPEAKPNTYNVVPNAATSWPNPKACVTPGDAGAKIALQYAATNAENVRRAANKVLYCTTC